MPSVMPVHSEDRCAQHALAMAGTTAGVSLSLDRRERNTNLPVLQNSSIPVTLFNFLPFIH